MASPDRRPRIGGYRVMYGITAQTGAVWHLGRGWTGSSKGKGIPQIDGLERG
jgi:hypothetical protein